MNITARPIKIEDDMKQSDHRNPEVGVSTAGATINEKIFTSGSQQLIRSDGFNESDKTESSITKQVLGLEGLG